MDPLKIFSEDAFATEGGSRSALSSDHGQRPSPRREALRAQVCRLLDELDAGGRRLATRPRGPAWEAATSQTDVHAGIAPLTYHLGWLRQRLLGDAPSLELVDTVEQGILALGQTLNALLTFSSGRKPRLQWVNVRQIVDAVCASLAGEIEARGVEITADVPCHLGLLADREMFRCAILNLASNAVDSMLAGGRLVITSYIGHRGLELEVADSGPGLSEEVIPHIFEPFYTTKRGAAGLGLAVVHRIAEAHGGEVLATNCPEGGAAFTLCFPNRARQVA
jgi:two-component system sensor histidine kinase HydH